MLTTINNKTEIILVLIIVDVKTKVVNAIAIKSFMLLYFGNITC